MLYLFLEPWLYLNADSNINILLPKELQTGSSMLMGAYHIRLLKKIWYPLIEENMLKECGKIKNPPLPPMRMRAVVLEAVITADKTPSILISQISQGVRQ